MINNALLMSATDPAYFGRVMSLTMLAWGSQGIAALPLGALADALSERAALGIEGALVLVVIAGMTLVTPSVSRRAVAAEAVAERSRADSETTDSATGH